MSAVDKVLRGIGIVVSAWILIWLGAFGIAWVTEAIRRQEARTGLWLVIPVLLSFASLVAGVVVTGIALEEK